MYAEDWAHVAARAIVAQPGVNVEDVVAAIHRACPFDPDTAYVPVTETIPDVWIDLFLAVADYCDGGYPERERPGLYAAYEAVLRSPSGDAVYARAVEGAAARWAQQGQSL